MSMPNTYTHSDTSEMQSCMGTDYCFIHVYIPPSVYNKLKPDGSEKITVKVGLGKFIAKIYLLILRERDTMLEVRCTSIQGKELTK